jgi:rSAM/selenodomain-associated transferase 1
VDLIVLAKEPVPGRVKTRLCPPCTPEVAAALAAAALADTLVAACASGADRVVLALDGRVGPWCPAGVDVVEQGTGDLARRLTTAWTATAGPALQIGMDTPQVTATELDAAFAALVAPGVDAVLGPAADGGWWAVGFRRPQPNAFLGVPTSRPDTGRLQAARLRSLGLTVAALPTQTDVDTWADAVAVAAEHPTTAFAGAVHRQTGLLELQEAAR